MTGSASPAGEAFTASDLERLRAAGMTPEAARDQIRLLREGSKPPRLLRPCTPGDGIDTLPAEALAELESEFLRAAGEDRWVHFIPASGAATRMASSLAGLASLEEGLRKSGKDPSFLWDLLGDPDAWAALPKALVPFHRYGNRKATPLEEHIREAAALAPGATARLHFTIAPEHEARFLRELAAILKALRGEGIRAEATHSFQDPSTQTVALDGEGNLFRSASGELVLRPGGHGALLRNLEACGGEFTWIRNIDNIAIEPVRAAGRPLRRALGGWLMRAARTADRPLRVCGMVRNTGQPGGGPFWVGASGAESVRIVESAEVDSADSGQRRIFESATHFNPVDLACALRSPSGEPYALADFRDPSACFVADKTHEGRRVRALEWPGLWNGSMAGWDTRCVEIPLSHFAPVKEVADLLNPEHTAL